MRADFGLAGSCFPVSQPAHSFHLLTCVIGKIMAPNPSRSFIHEQTHPRPTTLPVVHQDLSFEDALAQICDLLRCAAANAVGTTHGLSSDQRNMAGATEHLINSAKTLADRALDCLHGS